MSAFRKPVPTPDKMPTGPNPLPGLDEFVVKKKQYNLSLHAPYGMFAVDIDVEREVGFFEHAYNGFCGQFWLAGAAVVGSDHLLPRDVVYALRSLSIDVRAGTPNRRAW